MKAVQIIGAASGWGAQDRRCEAGPDVLRYQYDLASRLQQQGVPISWGMTVRPSSCAGSAMAAVRTLCVRLSEVTANKVAKGESFIVLGGDHSCAIGTWSGVSQMKRSAGPIGLIWIDAHLDSHLPETSPSGALHGMPLACLLGWGDHRLTSIRDLYPKLLPEYVALIGVRSFEPEEYGLLQRLGVKVFFMDEVRRRGLNKVFQDALEVVQDQTAGFGISIDLDAIDPKDAPAVGSPVPRGIAKEALIAVLSQLDGISGLIGLEIAEYNPALDKEYQTAHLIGELLAGVFCSAMN